MQTRSAPLSIRITEDMKARIEEAARDDDRSVSSLVILALKEFLDNQEPKPKRRKSRA